MGPIKFEHPQAGGDEWVRGWLLLRGSHNFISLGAATGQNPALSTLYIEYPTLPIDHEIQKLFENISYTFTKQMGKSHVDNICVSNIIMTDSVINTWLSIDNLMIHHNFQFCVLEYYKWLWDFSWQVKLI